jgi:hypothetical protein
MKSVEELDVFKLAHQLALETYRITKGFPKEETFSLVDQMRRAAASVGMNLVEGSRRLSSKEYRQFVGVALGSPVKFVTSCSWRVTLGTFRRMCTAIFVLNTTASFKC